MSTKNNLALAYHMGYDDALAKRMPDASKTEVLASGDLAAENAKLRELVKIAIKHCDSGTCDGCPIMGKDESCPYSDMARELGIEVD